MGFDVGGPIDPANEAHDMIMATFGSFSKGERTRIKTRVRTTMAALAQTQGRFLGDRPPYGYLLIDAGPHLNPAKAADHPAGRLVLRAARRVLPWALLVAGTSGALAPWCSLADW